MSDWRASDKRWEDRAERAYSEFSERPVRTGLKWWVIVVAVVLALSAIGGIVGYVGSWGSEAKRVVGVENVKEQNTQIIAGWEAMTAAAQNACNVKDSKSASGDPTLIEDPAVAYKATYRRVRADYNRRMANLYEAQAVRKLPLPSNLKNYPEVAPTLEAMQAQVC